MKNVLPIYILSAGLSMMLVWSCGDKDKGCTDPNAPNYNPDAQTNDGSCSYPSTTKKAVCFFFTDSDNPTCGSFGINLLNQVEATNPSNTYFIAVHPSTTDGLFAAPGIDIASAFSLAGFPDFGVGDQGNLLSQNAITNAIDAELQEDPQASTSISKQISGDSLIITIYGKFHTVDTAHYFVAAYVLEDNVLFPQAGLSGTYQHDHVLRASTGTSGIGTEINLLPVSEATSFKYRFGIYIQPSWDEANLKVVSVIWRKNGSDFEYINAGN